MPCETIYIICNGLRYLDGYWGSCGAEKDGSVALSAPHPTLSLSPNWQVVLRHARVFHRPDPAGNSRVDGIVATRSDGNDVEFQLNALAATAASATGAAFAGGLFLFTSAIAGRGKGT
jgi:hypothetical protein